MWLLDWGIITDIDFHFVGCYIHYGIFVNSENWVFFF